MVVILITIFYHKNRIMEKKMKPILSMVFLLICHSISAQNLLNNGTFDSDVSGWGAISGSDIMFSWVANDGNLSNGSLQIDDNINNGGFGSIVSHRISVIPNRQYRLSGFAKVLSNSEAQDAGFFVRFYNDENFQVGGTELVTAFNEPADQWNRLETIIDVPEQASFAEVAIAVGSSSSGSTNFSSARWDDLSFELITGNPNAFAMVPGHSALWFNPDQNGHGINVYLLSNQRVIVIWYVYDQQGSPLWLLGTGTHDGVQASLDVNIIDGPMFPPDFDSGDLNLQMWGQFTLEFTGCNAGNFKWNPISGNGFSAGEMDIVRLNATLGLTCNE